jgi:hypothetical protein
MAFMVLAFLGTDHSAEAVRAAKMKLEELT